MEGSRTNRYPEGSSGTPLVGVRLEGDGPTVWCKLEFLNPSGSTKDRIAGFILGNAARRGELRAGDWVVEASSGSTSIAMALACAQLGLRFVAVMPEGVSRERLLSIACYGGETVFTPREEGMAGAVAVAEEIARERGAFQPKQFENPENAEAHRRLTAREIIEAIPGGRVDAVVSGVGTGGTLVGLHRGLRDGGSSAKPFVARPVSAGLIGDVECCSLRSEFSGRIPGVVEGMSRIFREAAAGELAGLEEIEVPDDRALETTRALIRKGFPVGPSSGLNLRAAIEAARRLGPGAVVATVFPDRMERYFSTELFGGLGEARVAIRGRSVPGCATA